jgi:hypothetical protein
LPEIADAFPLPEGRLEGSTLAGPEGESLYADLPARAAEASLRLRPPASALKYSILTARYRLTIKGPDRGKWEFELVHDADAPLETVEQVVRGVVRRTGDDGEPDLLSSADFHRAVTEPWWTAKV